MGAADPRTTLETCENALRQLNVIRLQREFGDDWLNVISNSGQRRTWTIRAEAERRARPGVSTLPSAGLVYSDFSDLIDIANKHGYPSETALGPKVETPSVTCTLRAATQ